MKIQIENVRCIEKCELSLPPGSRTVLIGTNNAGKSTLLETIVKSLWSLPGYGNFSSGDWSGRLGLSSSYYRRQGTQIYRPRVSINISIPAYFPEEQAFTSKHQQLNFLLAGSVSPARVEANNPANTFLWPYELAISVGADLKSLFKYQNPIEGIADLQGQSAIAEISLRSEEDWINCRENSRYDNWGGQALPNIANVNNPFTRALNKFIGRTFNISAGRNPQFSAHGSDLDLRQDRIHEVTPLLKRLAFDPVKWNVLQSALTLLFDEISELRLLPVGENVAPHVLSTSGDLVPVSDMGFGLRNALQILAVMSVAPKGAILIVDEPEQGLNQARQRDFAKLLELLRPDLTLIVATQAEAFCKGLGSSSLYLVENKDGRALVEPIDLRNNQAHRKRMARAMGINPLYLVEGGKIIFVEGSSDQKIVSEWLELNFPDVEMQNVQIQDLGGVGKVEEEFAKPMFLNFKDGIFFLLDSDRLSRESERGANIQRLVSWFDRNDIANYYVLKRREIENYLGHESLARAAGINSNSIRPTEGSEAWFDFKEAVTREKGFYDENKITVNAYRGLDQNSRKNIFSEENASIFAAIKEFLSQ
ncbi:MAG: AAA family ATPase [Nitrospira sp.]|nr:AAA family ATPase [Nitrospira sp.]MBH0185786.1 AAA family ATPase [Nitrospira sp.]